ncbi:MAG: hypothetical protein OEX18_03110 [Candidatus Krumholzibacteria bacterium]|nr:hypothetical protein [Candidatus Krumholzibacteria bacterium]MDH4336248.1 hypothetical protein [Candidatus Krumholzibacteria bacterium]MDH5269713.1 hypothetical protein [Candidatus Krumholzibacteria bacterium]
MIRRYNCIPALLAVLLLALAPAAWAVVDAPVLSVGQSGHGKQTLTVTAGTSGLPDGFTIWWMDQATFASRGFVWPETEVNGQGAASFTGAPTLNTFGGQYTTFKLAPNASITIEIGDLFQETGVAGTVGELDYGTQYHFTAFATDGSGAAASGLSNTVSGSTTESTNCTYTQGFWKNHESAWPVMSLMLGSVNYSKAQLLSILGQSVQGNGLVSLAHQLIAVKLNIAAGADPTDASAAIAAADALIGGLIVPPVGGGYIDPSQTSALTQTLDDYNNGVIGPGHCGVVPTEQRTWGGVKSLYR